MEVPHRKLIKDNIDKLMDRTNLKSLMDCCVHTNLISVIMRNNLYKDFPEEKECHKQLFIKITQRGPKAFNLLMDILKSEFPSVEKVLYPDDEFQSIHENKRDEGYFAPPKSPIIENNEVDESGESRLKLQIYDKPVRHSLTIEVKKSDRIHYANLVDTYAMRSRYRGVFLLVNIIDFAAHKRREGAEIDRENLIYLFREFGFEVFYYENLRVSEFRIILDKMLKSKYTQRTECFVMAILSHGQMMKGSGRVLFHDSQSFYLDEIIENFSNPACPNLLGKPKVFVFPFCRGEVSDKGVYDNFNRQYVQTDGIREQRLINSPTISDIIKFYASVPGYTTHRDPDKGSWYIQTMCEVWAEHAHNTDLESLEKIVGERTGRIRAGDALQTSSREAFGFNKALYFNPGYIEGQK